MPADQIFPSPQPLIAMIHLRALPGTPAYDGQADRILAQARTEARLLADAGVDALLIENMHDTPYLRRRVGPEITAWMTAAALAVREAAPGLPCGIQILAGANREALAVAQAAGLRFVRAEGFVFGHVADEGWMDSDAGELLRYRRRIGAEDIAIFTDIKKKHSAHAATADVDLVATAEAAGFFRSDGLILTGTATGAAASIAEVQQLHEAGLGLPILIGSGITADNVVGYAPYCDGFIVGSSIKKDGHWAAALEEERVRELVAAVRRVRG